MLTHTHAIRGEQKRRLQGNNATLSATIAPPDLTGSHTFVLRCESKQLCRGAPGAADPHSEHCEVTRRTNAGGWAGTHTYRPHRPNCKRNIAKPNKTPILFVFA